MEGNYYEHLGRMMAVLLCAPNEFRMSKVSADGGRDAQVLDIRLSREPKNGYENAVSRMLVVGAKTVNGLSDDFAYQMAKGLAELFRSQATTGNTIPGDKEFRPDDRFRDLVEKICGPGTIPKPVRPEFNGTLERTA